jgi:hypothetical protein
LAHQLQKKKSLALRLRRNYETFVVGILVSCISLHWLPFASQFSFPHMVADMVGSAAMEAAIVSGGIQYPI